jgi:hypothetical protein
LAEAAYFIIQSLMVEKKSGPRLVLICPEKRAAKENASEAKGAEAHQDRLPDAPVQHWPDAVVEKKIGAAESGSPQQTQGSWAKKQT